MAASRLMVIASVGGLSPGVHGKRAALRCQPSVVTLAAPPVIVLDPFPPRAGKAAPAAGAPEGTPADGKRGMVAGGWARVVQGEAELDARPLRAPGPGRWDDLDLLSFAAVTLFGWIVLPAMLGDPALTVRELEPGRVEVRVPTAWSAGATRHVLHVDADGLVHRHEEGRLVHELTGHCDFEGVVVATRRRTRARVGGRLVPVHWADVVAAHVLPDPTAHALNERPRDADT